MDHWSLVEWIVVVYPCLVPCHNATKRSNWILVAIFHKFYATDNSIGTLKFQYPSRANLLHRQVINHDFVEWRFWHAQFISHESNRNLSIMHHDLLNSSNIFIDLWCCWSNASWYIIEASWWILELTEKHSQVSHHFWIRNVSYHVSPNELWILWKGFMPLAYCCLDIAFLRRFLIESCAHPQENWFSNFNLKFFI